MQKHIVIATGLGLALAMGWAWQANRAKCERQQTLAAAVRQRAALVGETRGVEGRIATAERERAELQTTLDGLRAAQVAASAPAAAKKSAPAPAGPSTDELLAQEPKLQMLYLASQRAGLATRYGPLFEALHLTSEQIAKFEDHILKRAEQRLDLESAMQALPGADNDRAAATLARQSAEEFQAAQIELLGADDYQQLRQYERSLPVRTLIVDRLGGELAATATPLTAPQAELLTQALANASSRYQKGGVASKDTINWEAVLAQTPGLLSAAQLETFKATVVREQISNKIFNALRAEKLLR
jgi:hypothetical protein